MRYGAFVGWVCPVHLGHEAVIKRMITESGGEGNCLMLIGSANHPLSMRHFFSYEERRKLLAAIFPALRVVGLPDYPKDAEWMVALDDILAAAGAKPAEVVFFGGCEEDVRFFIEAGRKTSILNRFDRSTPKISATEVRDALIHGRELEALLNPAVIPGIQETFLRKWEAFKRM